LDAIAAATAADLFRIWCCVSLKDAGVVGSLIARRDYTDARACRTAG
jgi:hypothetical protein